MGAKKSLGRQFAWLWTSYAISTLGTYLAFDAFPLIAILMLHVGPVKVSVLEASGMAVGAIIAVPVGPWIEFRSKRLVMIGMDLVRFAALLTIPCSFLLGQLTFAQLVVVAVIVGASDIAFTASSGAFLKTLVQPEDLLVASGHFESTTWTAVAIGPPLGGFAIGVFGPVVTVVADAVSYLFSAFGIDAIKANELVPVRSGVATTRFSDVAAGWKYIFARPILRGLYLNSILVGGLILATAPLVTYLMLGRLGFRPWQYGVAFGVPCLGGLVGSRIVGKLTARYGRHRVMMASGILRTCWSVGLALIPRGIFGIALVIIIEFGVVSCMGVFNPIYAALRLEYVEKDQAARVLSAWSVSSNVAKATLMVLLGLLAQITGPRIAIALGGIALLATPFLLPRREALESETAKSERNSHSPDLGSVLCAEANFQSQPEEDNKCRMAIAQR
jgi:MFS family permease